MQKICGKCKQLLDISEFYVHNKNNKQGYQSRCKKCSAITRREHYLNNREKEVTVRKRYEQDNRDWYIELKKTLKCSKCSESRWYVLDFHYSNGKKDSNISMIVKTQSKARTLKEIEKCIVLCANCHRELHHLERNTN